MLLFSFYKGSWASPLGIEPLYERPMDCPSPYIWGIQAVWMTFLPLQRPPAARKDRLPLNCLVAY